MGKNFYMSRIEIYPQWKYKENIKSNIEAKNIMRKIFAKSMSVVLKWCQIILERQKFKKAYFIYLYKSLGYISKANVAIKLWREMKFQLHCIL